MGEYTGVWFRVSTGGQDEQNQVPDVGRHVEDKGYEVARTYTLHGKSASKGEQQKELDRMLADMRAGVISVLVVWRDDRIERRGVLHMIPLINAVTEAGGRIEFVTQPHLNDLTTMAGRISLAVMSEVSHAESQTKRERARMTRDRIAADGGFVGRAAWGYETSGPRYAKTIVPTTEGRRLVPEVFARVIAGESLSTIARWLEAETGRAWWARSLGGMVRNATYRGAVEDGHGKVVHKCEPIVDAATWRRAGEALDSRPKRGPANAENRALLAGILFCGNPDCSAGPDSPMYRVNATQGGGWYRCSGRGSNRKGCGSLVRVVTLDGIVGMLMRNRGRDVEIMETKLIPGTDHAAELDEVRYQIRALATEDLTDDQYDTRLAELRAERDRLAALPSTPDRLESVGTGETYRDKWQRLSDQERGAWLRERGLTVRATKGHVTIEDSTGVIYEYTTPSHDDPARA
ncbi:MAG TPA: recombinase family protein [Streptosporangiaceae bacterium]|jgi:site-specific DNA recombinase